MPPPPDLRIFQRGALDRARRGAAAPRRTVRRRVNADMEAILSAARARARVRAKAAEQAVVDRHAKVAISEGLEAKRAVENRDIQYATVLENAPFYRGPVATPRRTEPPLPPLVPSPVAGDGAQRGPVVTPRRMEPVVPTASSLRGFLEEGGARDPFRAFSAAPTGAIPETPRLGPAGLEERALEAGGEGPLAVGARAGMAAFGSAVQRGGLESLGHMARIGEALGGQRLGLDAEKVQPLPSQVGTEAAIEAYERQHPLVQFTSETIASLPFLVGPLSSAGALQSSLRKAAVGRGAGVAKGLEKAASALEPIVKVERAPGEYIMGATKSIGQGLRAMTRPYRGLEPNSKEWLKVWRLNPSLHDEMSEYGRRYLDGLPIGEGGGVPLVTPGGPDEALVKMWKDGLMKPPVAVSERVVAMKRVFEELTTDRFAGLNRETERARSQWFEQFGVELPEALNAENHIAVMPGAGAAGIKYSTEALNASHRSLGKGIDRVHVDLYLHNKRMLEAKAQHPDRALVLGFTERETQKALNAQARTLGAEKMRRVRASAADMTDSLRALLDREVRSGLVAPDVAVGLKRMYPNYNPIALQEMILDHSAAGLSGSAINVTKPALRRLSEKGSEKATLSATQLLPRALAQGEILIARNDAAKSIVHMLQSLPDMAKDMRKVTDVVPVAVEEGKVIYRPAPPKPGSISYYEGGQRVTWDVPEWVAREANALAETATDGPLFYLELAGRIANAIPRAVLTSYNPGFMAGNFMFDMITVAMMQGVGPQTALMALGRNLRALLKEDATLSRMIKAGGDPMGYYGRSPAQIAKDSTMRGDFAIRRESDWQRLFTRPWDTVRDVGHAIELAPRRAVFEKALLRGSTDKQAAVLARRTTVDFQRAGSAIRMANNYFLYLNPALQGAILPFRALLTDRRRFPLAKYGVGAFMAASVALYAHNRQYPEYMQLPWHERLGKFTITLPSNEFDRHGNKVAHRINLAPLREFSLISAPITHLLSKLDEKNPDDVSTFLSALFPLVNPLEGVVSFKAQLPISFEEGKPRISVGRPQYPTFFGQRWQEIGNNRDEYRQRDIIPLELMNLEPAEQFNEFTSETARRVGGWLNVSPMQIDYLMRSGLGWDLMASADRFLRRWQDGVDTDIDDMVQYLHDIDEDFAPDDARMLRGRIMAQMEKDERKAVEVALRAPRPTIPFWDSIKRRFYRVGGAQQLYRTGLAQAAREANVSVEQVNQAFNTLSAHRDDRLNGQQERNAAWSAGDVTGKQWRTDRAKSFLGANATLLRLGVEVPSVKDLLTDNEQRGAFFDSVYTISGYMPDSRTKGELLLAALYAIPMAEVAKGVDDVAKLYRDQEEFKDGLSASDKEVLQQMLEKNDTPLELIYRRGNEVWQSYWEVPQQLLESADAGQADVTLAEYHVYQREKNIDLLLAQEANEFFAQFDARVGKVREGMRRENRDLEEHLLRWDYVTSPIHPDLDPLQATSLEEQVARREYWHSLVPHARKMAPPAPTTLMTR